MRLYLYKSSSEEGKQDVQFKQQTGTREIPHPFLRELIGIPSQDFTASVHQHFAQSELVSSIVLKYKNNFSWKLIEPANSNWQNFEKPIPVLTDSNNSENLHDRDDDISGLLSLDLLDKRKELRNIGPSVACMSTPESEQSEKSSFTPFGTNPPPLCYSGFEFMPWQPQNVDLPVPQPKPSVLAKIRPHSSGFGPRGIGVKYNSGIGKMHATGKQLENNHKELLNSPVYFCYLFGFDKKPFLAVGTDELVDILTTVT